MTSLLKPVLLFFKRVLTSWVTVFFTKLNWDAVGRMHPGVSGSRCIKCWKQGFCVLGLPGTWDDALDLGEDS